MDSLELGVWVVHGPSFPQDMRVVSSSVSAVFTPGDAERFEFSVHGHPSPLAPIPAMIRG